MRNLFFLLIIIFPFLLNAQKGKSYEVHWRDSGKNPFIDAAGDFRFSEKGKYYYLISNDMENIYVDIKIFPKEIQRMVYRDGITIWMNSDGKKGKKRGIRFPVNQVIRPGMAGEPGRNLQRPQNPSERNTIVGEPGQFNPGMADMKMELMGIGNNKSEMIPSGGSQGYYGSLTTEKDYLHYEVIFPIKTLLSSEKKGKANELVIGISYNEINTPSRGGLSGGGPSEGMGGGAPGGGMRGGGGGGMRGGGGGGMRGGSGMSSSPRSQSAMNSGTQNIFWIKDLRLSTK